MKPKISASLLAADFLHLAESISDVEKAGIDELHFDIMDGAFVPQITFGPVILEAVSSATSLPIDAHMMVRNPEHHIPTVASAGAHVITVHAEAVIDIDATIDTILDSGAAPAVAVRPRTPISAITRVIDRIERVLIMTVEPGFGGQPFMHDQLTKIQHARQMADTQKGRRIEIAVDGGINEDTIPLAARAGATTFISGTGIFQHRDGVRAAVRAARQAAQQAIAD